MMQGSSRNRFRRVTVLVALCFAALPAAAAEEITTFAALPTGQGVVRVYFDDPSDVRSLVAYDVWESVKLDEGYVQVAVDDRERAEIEALGFVVTVDEEFTARINEVREPLPGQVHGIPGFPCYRTVEEVYATAAQMVVDHPDLASWIDFGDSWEKTELGAGWDLMVLRLTNSAVPGPKPKLVVTSSIHAREYTPAELMTRFAESLVDGYGIDADVTFVLDHHEVHLVLLANPDARKKAETGILWRKNTNQDYCSPTSNDRGADLNRNFDFQWGCCGGSSGFECDTLYRGPSPASEPETQAIQAYLRAVFPDQRDDPLDSPAPPEPPTAVRSISATGISEWRPSPTSWARGSSRTARTSRARSCPRTYPRCSTRRRWRVRRI